MGIPGLLKELNALVGKDAHISAYRGKCVAVDASGWLHRSTYSCALELLLNIPTTAYAPLLRTLLLTLLDHEVKPIIVFDGAHLPAKQATDAKREVHRQRHRAIALRHHASGNAELALYHAQQAAAVTPAITHCFLSLCRELSVDFLVAPYEADAQMALLMQCGHVHACVTEDSDLVPFGCSRLFIKLERTGVGREISVADIATATGNDPFVRRLKAVVSEHGLLGMCVLSGCDYLPSLRGMGVRTAARWWSEWRCIEMIVAQLKKAKHKRKKPSKRRPSKRTADATPSPSSQEPDVVDLLSDEDDGDGEGDGEGEGEEEEEGVESDDDASENRGKLELYEGYPMEFHKAILTFRHQLVYDPTERCYRHLNQLPSELLHLSPLTAATAAAQVLPVDDASAVFMHDPDVVLSARLSQESRHNARLTSLDFLGVPPPAHLTDALITGKLNPNTLKPLVVEEPSIHSFFAQANHLRYESKQGSPPSSQDGEGGVDGSKRGPVDVERVFGDLGELLEGRSWQSTTASPLQAKEPVQSTGSGRGGGDKSRSTPPKTKAELDRERRDREEKRSTGGGLRRFFFSSTTAQCNNSSNDAAAAQPRS